MLPDPTRHHGDRQNRVYRLAPSRTVTTRRLLHPEQARRSRQWRGSEGHPVASARLGRVGLYLDLSMCCQTRVVPSRKVSALCPGEEDKRTDLTQNEFRLTFWT